MAKCKRKKRTSMFCMADRERNREQTNEIYTQQRETGREIEAIIKKKANKS